MAGTWIAIEEFVFIYVEYFDSNNLETKWGYESSRSRDVFDNNSSNYAINIY